MNRPRLAPRPGLVAAAVVMALGAPATPAHGRQPWSFAVGHSYSSAQALRQPAGLTAIRKTGGPWLTQLDAGLLISGPAFPGLLHAAEFGVRLAGGSARDRGDRVHGALLRGVRALDGLRTVLAVAGEYEADGGFDIQKGLLGIEATPFGVAAAALGRWSGGRDTTGVYWRPWAGVGWGNVLDADAPAGAVEADGFWRAWLRIEAAWRPPATGVELVAEGTSWLLDGDRTGMHFGRASLSLPLGSGLAFTVAAERGRRPPRFTRSSLVSVGLGYRRPAAR